MPANAAVVVAGDVDVAQVRALAEKYYGSIPTRAVPARKPRTEPPQRGRRRIEVKALPSRPMWRWRSRARAHAVDAPSAEDRDALALIVLSAVLSGCDGARLERALTQGAQRVAGKRRQRRLGHRARAVAVCAHGVPAGSKTARQVETPCAELARVARDGVSAAELERVKTQWIAAKGVRARFGHAPGAKPGPALECRGWPLDAEDRLLAQLRTVTPQQVQAVAQRYFGDDSSPY